MNHPKFVDITLIGLHHNNEWAHEILHTSFEDLSFQFVSIYVPILDLGS
jgi:hypothetical protein